MHFSLCALQDNVALADPTSTVLLKGRSSPFYLLKHQRHGHVLMDLTSGRGSAS